MKNIFSIISLFPLFCASYASAMQPDPTQQSQPDESESQQYSQKQKQSAYSNPDVRQNIFAENGATVNNYERPNVIIPNAFHQRGSTNKESEEDEARIEGKLRAVAQISTQEALIQHRIANPGLSKEMAQQEIDISLFKKDYLKDKIPMAKRLQESNELVEVQTQAQIHQQGILRAYQNATLDARLADAQNEGKIKAAFNSGMISQSLQSSSAKDQFLLTLREVGVRTAADLTFEAIKFGSIFTATQLYRLLLMIPHPIFQKLRKQDQDLSDYQRYVVTQKKQEEEKIKQQQSLAHDFALLEQRKSGIEYIEKTIATESNPQEKEKLQKFHKILHKQFYADLMKLNMLSSAVVDNQPHMQPLLAKIAHQMSAQQGAQAGASTR